MLEDWSLRLRSLFRRNAVERELDEEIQFHVREQVAAYQAEGLSHDEAVRRARLAFGTFDQVKEEHRDARGVRLLDDLVRDVRYAARQLARSPVFTAAAVTCLGLGIGATAAIYSIVNTVLLQPLPFPDSERLVRVVEHVPSRVFPDRPAMQQGIPYRDFVDWAARARTLSDAIAISGMGQQLVRTSHGTAGLWGAMTSPHAFRLLGVRAILGRTFDAADAGNPDVALLTFDTWQRHFNGDQSVVGTILELRAGALVETAPPRLLTVVGVLPADFEFPAAREDFYAVLRPPLSADYNPRLTMLGWLAPGASLAAATAELNAMGAASRAPWPAATPPAPSGSRFEIQSVKELAVGDLKPALRILLAAVGVVLLIVCANVANLLLARGTARRQEMAVRLAIGASRARIVRQVMTECLVLAAAGGLLGAALAVAGVLLVKRLALVDAPGIFVLMFGTTILPRAHEVRVDVAVLGIAFGIAAVTSIVFGLLPALHLSHRRQIRTIGTGMRGEVPSSTSTAAALVVVQLGLATTLLVGAGLLIHGFVKLSNNDKGYDASGVVALQLLLPNQYSPARKAQAIDTMLAALRQVPGVQAAGFARHGMLIGEELVIGTFVPPGRGVDEMRARPPRQVVRSVSEGFLTAMNVPLVAGREFTVQDGPTAPPVVVMNRLAAATLFGTANAVGRTLNWHLGGDPVQVRVVGVVDNVRQTSLAQDAFPEVYVHYRQLLTLLERTPAPQRLSESAIGFLSFAIRTSTAPESALPAIRRVVTRVEPNAGIDVLVPMTRLVAASVARPRFSAVLLAVFATVAGLLAAIGVYGVLSYLVAQRTPEIGLRMALGAGSTQVQALVLRKGLLLGAAGLALGLAGAAAVTRVLQGLLFGLSPLDPLTFLAVAVAFGCVTMLASYVPARRATRVDPMVALRSE